MWSPRSNCVRFLHAKVQWHFQAPDVSLGAQRFFSWRKQLKSYLPRGNIALFRSFSRSFRSLRAGQRCEASWGDSFVSLLVFARRLLETGSEKRASESLWELTRHRANVIALHLMDSPWIELRSGQKLEPNRKLESSCCRLVRSPFAASSLSLSLILSLGLRLNPGERVNKARWMAAGSPLRALQATAALPSCLLGPLIWIWNWMCPKRSHAVHMSHATIKCAFPSSSSRLLGPLFAFAATRCSLIIHTTPPIPSSSAQTHQPAKRAIWRKADFERKL